MWLNIALVIGSFFAMEFLAWFTHKYVMHGFLWHLHKDHHHKNEGRFLERNDLFFLIFAIPGILLFIAGAMRSDATLISLATGITLYGICYFLVHDVFIHQRFKRLRNTENVYLRSIRKAHKMHHKHSGKQHGECYGMLIVKLRYLREAQRAQKPL